MKVSAQEIMLFKKVLCIYFEISLFAIFCNLFLINSKFQFFKTISTSKEFSIVKRVKLLKNPSLMNGL